MGPRQISGLSPGFSSPTEITFRPCASSRLDAVVAKNFWLRVDAEHERHVGAVDVSVEQADFVAEFGQRERQIYR